MKNKIDLSIVIPAFKEELRIGKTLEILASEMKSKKFYKNLNIEVIVSAADAGDKTHQVVNSKKKLFKNLVLVKPGKKVGKGRDVKAGMVKARGAAVVFMDADLSTPIKYVPIFYREFKKGNEVIVATRNLRIHHKNVLRRVVSNLGNAVYRILGGVWIEDSQCGFKMFSKQASYDCFSNLNIMGWGFDMEILTIAKVNGYRIKTIRVNDWEHAEGGTLDDNIIINSLLTIKDLFFIFYNRMTGRYKIK